MTELNHQPRCFCTLGFQINALVDKGESCSVSEILKMAEGGTLIGWLEEKIDMSLWDDEDKIIMSVELASLSNCTATGDFGINNNGLSMLVAFCFEFIQNKPSRNIKNCEGWF